MIRIRLLPGSPTTPLVRRIGRHGGQQLFQRAIDDKATALDTNRFELAAFDQCPNRRIAEPAHFSGRRHRDGQRCCAMQVLAGRASARDIHRFTSLTLDERARMKAMEQQGKRAGPDF
jgi:hypothetical protein